MPAPDLEAFFEHATQTGGPLQPEEKEFLRIRRRRQSVELAAPAESEPEPEPPPVKVVVLGDEASSGKVSMAELLCLDPAGAGAVGADALAAGRAEFLPLDLRRLALRVAAGDEAPEIMELWAPGQLTSNTRFARYV